jgi:hypothetical protein
MNKLYKLMGCLIFLVLFNQNASAQLNPPFVLDGGHVMLTWNAPVCIMGNTGGWSGNKFKVSYREFGTLGWDGVSYTNDEFETYDSSLFENGVTYRFKVEYFGQNENCRNKYKERTLGNKYFNYFNVDQNGTAVFHDIENTQGLKKIHNEYSDKCLYPHTWDGGSVDSVRIFQWGCYPEDVKAFDIFESILYGTDVVYLPNVTLGYCITPKNLSFGSEIGVGSCSSPLAAYVKVPSVLPGRFLLKNWLTDQCIHASSVADGTMMIQTACDINYEKQMFYFEDY